ncbi:MAG: PipA/GogA/GtgA family type III secretion system effector [Janthinobacterium lividum]
MRLPRLDLTLLAIDYVLSGAAGAAPRDLAAAPRPWASSDRPQDAAALAYAERAGRRDAAQHVPARVAHATKRRSCARDRRRRATPAQTDASRPSTGAGAPAIPPASRARATPALLADWSLAWTTLPTCQRAERALAIARANHSAGDPEQRLALLTGENHDMTMQWLTQPVMSPPRPANATDAPPARPGQDAVDLYWHLQLNPALTLPDAVAVARRLTARARLPPATREAQTLYQASRLADLFDLTVLRDASHTPLDLLRQVHAVLNTRFPAYRAPLLDEHAIAVAAQLRQRCTAAFPNASGALPRRDFAREVRAELTADALTADILPWDTTPPADGHAWFDGVAVRDAQGKNLTDLVADLKRTRPALVDHLRQRQDIELKRPPPGGRRSPIGDAAPDDHALVERWMRKRLRDLVESTRFPFGTPPQSIHTVLLRLCGMHGLRCTQSDDLVGVLRDFRRLCATWRVDPAYWVSPTLAAAIHLAHASGTGDRLTDLDPMARENDLIDVFHERLRAYQASDGTLPATQTGKWRRTHLQLPPGNRTKTLMTHVGDPQAPPPPDWKDSFLDMTGSLLVLPRGPMHVGQIMLRGQPRETLGLLPFVVPAYDIEEGVRLGNGTRAVRGAFQFGADVLMAWIGGRIDASLAVREALPALARGERAALAMLHRGVATLGEPRPHYLPLVEPVAIEPPAAMRVATDDSAIPLPYRHLASRARDGGIVPIDLPNVPNARLIHLRHEDRVIPVGTSDVTVWELNWDGHIVGTVADRRLGDLRDTLLAEARGPALRTPSAGAEPSVFDQGVTVATTQRWFAAHPTALQSRRISEWQTDAALSSIVDVDEDRMAEVAIYQELGNAYRRSETFRLLAHQRTPRPDGKYLRFSITPGAMPRYLPDQHVIALPPVSELAEIEYQGPRGSVRFDPRDVWIHEFVHAMTLLTDPEPALATRHRGPVVYFTDRILYEINRPSAERITYAHPGISGGAVQRERTIERVVRENILLDEQLALRTTMHPDTPVLGVAVQQRATVVAAMRIEEEVRAALATRTTHAPFPKRLLDALRLSVTDEGAHPSPHLRLIREFVHHAQAMYQSSAWARGYLDAWLGRDVTTQWTIHRLSRILAERHGIPCRVQPNDHRIELSYADSFAYLGPTGLQPYTMRRRVASLLAELALPARARAAHIAVDLERGAVVYAENKLLGLGVDSEERRLSARIWRSRPGIPSLSAERNPTLARRVADDEDRFLAAHCPPTPEGGCICS